MFTSVSVKLRFCARRMPASAGEPFQMVCPALETVVSVIQSLELTNLTCFSWLWPGSTSTM